MSTGTIKKDSGFGVAQLILFISIAVLVIFVAWQVLLILFNAFFVDGSFNSHDFYAVLTEPETFHSHKFTDYRQHDHYRQYYCRYLLCLAGNTY